MTTMRAPLIGASLAVAVVLGLSCNALDRSRQVQTFGDMQVMTKMIADLQRTGHPSVVQVRSALRRVHDGRDAWGNEVSFFARAESGLHGYILVSPGSDGKFESEDESYYLRLEQEDIRGISARDIVFRDGKAVTNAGKDRSDGYPRKVAQPTTD
jgi:hypothetical protein